MKILKTNRKKLYELVKKYSKYTMPVEKNTYFEQASRRYSESPAYWLRFSDQDGKYITVYLEIFMGQPTMRIYCRAEGYDKIFHPTEEELEGMIEERKELKHWMITWQSGDPESFLGTEEQVEQHAQKKSKERGGYIIT